MDLIKCISNVRDFLSHIQLKKVDELETNFHQILGNKSQEHGNDNIQQPLFSTFQADLKN